MSIEKIKAELSKFFSANQEARFGAVAIEVKKIQKIKILSSFQMVQIIRFISMSML